MQDRSRESFLAVFLEAQDSLRSVCHAMAGDPHLADDLFQEMAMAGWKSFARFDPQQASFATWMRAILRNVHAKHWRRRDSRMALLSPESVHLLLEASAETVEDTEQHRLNILQRCMQRLSGPVQELLRLRYAEDLSRAEIAERSDRSEAAVKKALFRARAALVTCMAEKGTS